MRLIITDACPQGNAQANSDIPDWIVLHGGSGFHRRRWCRDMERLLTDLVNRYGWVTWREGRDAHVKLGGLVDEVAA